MSRLNLLLGIFASGGLAVAIATFWLALAAPFVLVPRGRRERLVMWTNRAASWMILRFALLATLDVKGREHLPEKPYMVVCNHRGFCDVLTLIWAANAEGVSKREVLYFPAMGLLGYLGGAVFFDRKSPEDRRRAKEDTLFQLRSGNAMHLYPEGTRARTGLVRQKQHWGLVHAVYAAGIQVVPAAVWGTDDVIPVSNAGVRYGQRVSARFAPAVQPADHPTQEAFCEAIWAETSRMVEELYSADPGSAGASAGASSAGAVLPPTSNM